MTCAPADHFHRHPESTTVAAFTFTPLLASVYRAQPRHRCLGGTPVDLPPKQTRVQERTHEYRHPWPWQLEHVLEDCLDRGLTRVEMAEELGTSTHTVGYWLDKHDLR